MDHQTIFKSVLVATRPTIIKNIVNEIYSFEILSSTEWNYSNKFQPNYFIEISKKNLMKKWKALKCYKTETQKNIEALIIYTYPQTQKSRRATQMIPAT